MESYISVGLHVTTGNNAFVIVLNISHILLSRSVIRYSMYNVYLATSGMAWKKS